MYAYNILGTWHLTYKYLPYQRSFRSNRRFLSTDKNVNIKQSSKRIDTPARNKYSVRCIGIIRVLIVLASFLFYPRKNKHNNMLMNISKKIQYSTT